MRPACDSDRRETIPRMPLHREQRVPPLSQSLSAGYTVTTYRAPPVLFSGVALNALLHSSPSVMGGLLRFAPD